MAEKLKVNPTRMELLKLKRKLKTAERGHKLLKEKRDGLMKQFMTLIKETLAARESVEGGLSEAFQSFVFATADYGPDHMEQAMSWPTKTISLEAKTKNVMSVYIPEFTYSEEGHHESYSLFTTSGQIDTALETFSNTLPDMLKLASLEHSARLLAIEIEKTRRRVNALEHVYIPQMQVTIKYIESKLGEQERGALVTLMKVKDMIEAKQ